MDTQQYLTLHLNGTSLNDQQLFCNQKQTDIYITLNKTNATFGLHSHIVSKHCEFFRNYERGSPINVSQDFKEQHFSKIMSLLYGFTIKLNRSDILSYYSIAHFLKVYTALQIMQNDMTKNLIEYDIFRVIHLASNYNLYDILDLCLRELLNEDFQQINYNIFDLLGCPQSVFRLVINYHNKMRSQRQTQGLSWEKVQEVVKQYCDANNVPTIKAKHLLHELVDHKELFQQQNQKKHSNRVQIGNIPVSELMNARQNQAKPSSSVANKMTESLISGQKIGTNFPSTPPVRGSAFYSHIWETDQSQKGFFPAANKLTSYTTSKTNSNMYKIENANKSSDNPFKSKRNAFQINQVGQDEEGQQFKKHHIKVKPVQRFVSEPISHQTQSRDAYKDIPKINFNTNIYSQSQILTEGQKNKFKKFVPQNSNSYLQVGHIAHNRKLSQHVPRANVTNLNIKTGNQAGSPINQFKRQLNDAFNVQSPLTPKQIIRSGRQDSPPTFGNRNQMMDMHQTPSPPKRQLDQIIKKQATSFTDRPLVTAKSQQKAMKGLKIGRPKQSLDQMAKITIRKDSFEMKQNISQQSRPSILQAQLFKQLQQLNRMSMEDQQSNKKMSHQIDKMKGQMNHSTKRYLTQKNTLDNVQKSIEVLELQFRKSDNELYGLGTKIDNFIRNMKIPQIPVNNDDSIFQDFQ